MKKFSTRIFSIGLVTLLLCMPFSTAAKAVNGNSPPWKIVPGTNEWQHLNSHDEMVAVCQLSDDQITNMSTDDLLNALLTYPLLIDMFVCDSLQSGFELIRSNFNGIEELLTRPDASEVIARKYASTPAFSTSKSTATNESYATGFLCVDVLETLLAQPEIYDKMSSSELAAVNFEILEKHNQRTASGLYDDAFLEVREELTGKNYSAICADLTSKSPVYQQAKTIFLSDSAQPLASNYVTTPKGTKVNVSKPLFELTSAKRRELDEYVKNTYPGATLLASATRKYNCHSYAWYSQSTSNPYWMDDPSAYMRDGSYKSGGFKVNNKIYYSTPGYEHSGVVTGVKVGMAGCYVTSKWGNAGLVSHFYNYCPYFKNSAQISYWERA